MQAVHIALAVDGQLDDVGGCLKLSMPISRGALTHEHDPPPEAVQCFIKRQRTIRVRVRRAHITRLSATATVRLEWNHAHGVVTL